MAATGSISFSRIDSGQARLVLNPIVSSATFQLSTGNYVVDVVGSSYGTITVERLGPDGSTYVTAMTAFSANGAVQAYLPQGTYKIVLA